MRPEHESKRFSWLVSFHLYVVQKEYRFDSEVEARLKHQELDDNFKSLLGSSYQEKIGKFGLTCKPIQRHIYSPRNIDFIGD